MKKKDFLIILTLGLLTIFVFIRVIQHPQLYYDDFANIFNSKIATKCFNLQTVKDVLTFSFGGFRPLSYLSFYLNYLFWGNGTDNLFPYIVFNVFLHFLNSILVYFLSLKLSNGDFKLSFLTSIAWAVSPANSLAVVYLVQRMTELMFFSGLISFLFFINYLEKKKNYLLVFSLIFLILSILSKQNGVLFIPVFAVYFLWFGDKKVDIKKLYVLLVLFYMLFLIVAGEYYLPQSIVRGFTPLERLLTEARVLVYYLKVLTLPVQNDVFLYVSSPLSKSIVEPISTLLSILFLVTLFCLSYFFYYKNRLISFGLISFFIFHSIESSTIPLYIAFLHRNYGPSFFLYLSLFALLLKYVKNNTVSLLIAFVIIANFIFVSKVHNVTYTSPFYYLSRNYEAFPDNKDLCAALGRRYNKIGRYKEAINFFIKSFKPDKLENRLELVMGAFYNMGCYNCVIQLKSMIGGAVIYQIVGKAYKKIGDFKDAEYYFKKSLDIGFNQNTLFAYLDLLAKNGRFRDIIGLIDRYKQNTGENELITMYLINSYIELGYFDKTKPLFKRLKTKNVYFWLMGKYLLKKGDIDRAIEVLKSVKVNVFTPANMFIGMQKTLLLSEAYAAKGDYNAGIKILKEFGKRGFFENVIEKQIEKLNRMKNGNR